MRIFVSPLGRVPVHANTSCPGLVARMIHGSGSAVSATTTVARTLIDA